MRNVNGRVGLTLLMIMIGVIGCGDSKLRTAETDASTASAVVLSAPPTVTLAGTLGAALSYSAGSSSADVAFQGIGVSATLTFPGAGVYCISSTEKSGVTYVLVGTLDSSEVFSLHRVHDSDADGLPDISTRVEVFSTAPEKAYITSIWPTSSASLYVLDKRCQDIRAVEDTNSDGWHDSWESTPFARSSDFPKLLDVNDARSMGGNSLKAEATEFAFPIPGMVLSPAMMERLQFSDLTSDGVADSQSTVGPTMLSPQTHTPLFDGQDSVTVLVLLGGKGKTVEVWEVDSGGADVLMLGSASISVDGSASAEVSLSQALEEGDRISVRFSGAKAHETIHLVVDDVPIVRSVDHETVEIGTAKDVVVTGANFTSTMGFRMQLPSGDVQVLPHTFTNSTTCTLHVPAISAAEEGHIRIWGVADGQDEDAAHGVVEISACTP